MSFKNIAWFPIVRYPEIENHVDYANRHIITYNKYIYIFFFSCFLVADATGGTISPEETPRTDERASLPTASSPHALEACCGGLWNGKTHRHWLSLPIQLQHPRSHRYIKRIEIKKKFSWKKNHERLVTGTETRRAFLPCWLACILYIRTHKFYYT